MKVEDAGRRSCLLQFPLKVYSLLLRPVLFIQLAHQTHLINSINQFINSINRFSKATKYLWLQPRMTISFVFYFFSMLRLLDLTASSENVLISFGLTQGTPVG